MAIKYVDYDGAAGTGDGSSFANRAAKLEDITSYMNTSNDEVRIKGNPVTSVGTCITGVADRHHAGAYGPRYCDYTDVVYSTTTGQTYIKEVGLGPAGTGTTSQGAGGWQTGDRIFIINDASATNQNQPSIAGIWEVTVANSYDDTNGKVYLNGYTANSNGANTSSGTFKWLPSNSDVVKLNTTGITKDIACTDPDRSAWTSAGTATTSINHSTSAWQSSGVEHLTGGGSDKIVVPSSQAVGKIAHYQLPSALDLSGYQQISFMIRSDAGGFTTADEIKLCTDTGGNTAVHTAPIKLRKANEKFWVASVTDLGANMNSSIQSVALYRAATQSSQCTYRLQNIVACKDSSSADSLTHKSLIGLDDGIWYNINWFDKDFVCVKCADNFAGAKWSYYNGGANAKWKTTGNAVNLYKVEPFYPSFAETTDEDEYLDGPPSSYSYQGGVNLLISGGWNSTDMSTKSGATIIQGNNWGVWNRKVNGHHLHYKDLYIHGFFQAWNNYYCDSNKWENVGWAHSSSTDSDLFYECMSIKVLKLDYITGCKKAYYNDCSQHTNSTKSDFVISYVRNADNGGQFQFEREDDTQLTSDCSTDFKASLISFNPGGYNARAQIHNFDNIDIDTIDCSNCYYGANSGIYSWSDKSITKIGTFNIKNGGYWYNNYLKDVTVDTFDSTRPIHPTSPTTLPGRMMGTYWEPSVEDIQQAKATGTMLINGGILGGNVSASGGSLLFNNIQINDNYSGVLESVTGSGLIEFRNFDQVSGDNRRYSSSHIFSPNTSVRNTASGYSIKAQVSDTTTNPTGLLLGSIIVNGGSAVTISLYGYFSGTGESITLRVPARPFMGLTSDQTAVLSGVSAANWHQVTKTFTPTSSGKLDIYVDFTNNNTSSVMYIDDFGATQA